MLHGVPVFNVSLSLMRRGDPEGKRCFRVFEIPTDARGGSAVPHEAAEVTRYRAGEKKLLGLLIGAAMREAGASADAAAVRKVLAEKLG